MLTKSTIASMTLCHDVFSGMAEREGEGVDNKLDCLSYSECILVQEPKEKRRGSLSFNSRVWQPSGSKYTFMLLYILARRHFEKGTGDSKFTLCSPE